MLLGNATARFDDVSKVKKKKEPFLKLQEMLSYMRRGDSSLQTCVELCFPSWVARMIGAFTVTSLRVKCFEMCSQTQALVFSEKTNKRDQLYIVDGRF